MLDLRHVPLNLVKQLVIPFKPNGPKCDASKYVPNFNFWSIFTRDSFPEQRLLPVETIIVVGFLPTKFMHDVRCPPPSPSSLNAVPKLMFDQLSCVRDAKYTLLGDGCQGNENSPLINRHWLCQIDQMNMAFFPARYRFQTCD